MMASSSEYKVLQQDSCDSSEHIDDHASHDSHALEHVSRHWGRVAILSILAIVLGSIALNALLLYERFHLRAEESRSYYTGIAKNVPTAFTYGGTFTDEDMEIQDAAWSVPEMEAIHGLVALTDDFALSKNVPPAQRWPWDPKKGIYYLNSFHTLHCTHLVRKVVKDAYAGILPKSKQLHVMHCLNTIREEIMCNADDTPRYTGKVNAEKGTKGEATSGIGQIRMCKNWDNVVKWADEHSACYNYVNRTTPNFPLRDRYKFCPDGSKPWLDVE